VVAIIRTPPAATGGLAAAEGDVWIAADVQGVLRVDAAANRIESTISVEAGQLLLAIDGVVEGDGAVWVGGAWTTKAVARGAADGPGDESVGNGAIARIDPRTSAVVATIPFARPATPLMPSGNVLWVESGGVLSRMDMRTNRVVGGEVSPSGWVDPADKVLWVGTGTSMLTRVPLASVIRGVG